MSIIVIGLGNPILGDDGVGWRVAEHVRSRLHAWQAGAARRAGEPSFDPPSVEVECLSLGGLSLMERLVGYHRALIIDAIASGDHPPGTVASFPLNDLPVQTGSHLSSAHDTSLQTAIQLGKLMGAPLPEEVWVIAVEAQVGYDFSEDLTPPIAAAVPLAARLALQVLAGWVGDGMLSTG